jgi:hypothetical protein
MSTRRESSLLLVSRVVVVHNRLRTWNNPGDIRIDTGFSRWTFATSLATLLLYSVLFLLVAAPGLFTFTLL